MTVAVILIVVVLLWLILRAFRRPSIAHLPERFVVVDLETTGLRSDLHEIIEIGAIRVNRDSSQHDTFQALVKSTKRVPKRITEITGITQDLLDRDGEALESAFPEFLDFVGDLPLVSYNADFDMAFLNEAARKLGYRITNRTACALKMARRAWPGRRSYKLVDLARDGNLPMDGVHRALGDCKRAMLVYTAAAARLGTMD